MSLTWRSFKQPRVYTILHLPHAIPGQFQANFQVDLRWLNTAHIVQVHHRKMGIFHWLIGTEQREQRSCRSRPLTGNREGANKKIRLERGRFSMLSTEHSTGVE